MTSKYQAFKDRFACVEVPDVVAVPTELELFDWFNFHSTAPKEVFVPDFISVLQVEGNESIRDRHLRMLRQLSATCVACSMCELGLKGAERSGDIRDPHVLSNLNPAPIILVGQNPGWTELEKREPFVGQAGANFDAEIAKHGVDRSWFYIANTVRCYTKDNARPTQRHMDRCEPFLRMEIGLLKPKLVVALGAVAFSQLCPNVEFSAGLKKITKSTKFDVPVFGVYHPSPLNMMESSRKIAFAEQIRILCGLAKAIRSKNPAG